MPIVPRSDYQPPCLLSGKHLQTVLPTFHRRFKPNLYRRERIETPDGDFLDLDWAGQGSDKVAVLSHGLEGDSHRHYMIGMARMLNRYGWDAVAWNYRGCSGEKNRKLRMYHNGCIDDLDTVVRHVLDRGGYSRAALLGFSLGGNLTLLYLGRNSGMIDERVRSAVAFSVPCDLAAGARELARPANWFYMKQFLVSLHQKVRTKMADFPGMIDDRGYEAIKDFKGFDDRYTAPIHGFASAEDYWEKCSSGRVLHKIAIPTLLVNALDDPFLAESCFPRDTAASSEFLHLETPRWGGHVGFMEINRHWVYWSERRALRFLES